MNSLKIVAYEPYLNLFETTNENNLNIIHYEVSINYQMPNEIRNIKFLTKMTSDSIKYSLSGPQIISTYSAHKERLIDQSLENSYYQHQNELSHWQFNPRHSKIIKKIPANQLNPFSETTTANEVIQIAQWCFEDLIQNHKTIN